MKKSTVVIVASVVGALTAIGTVAAVIARKKSKKDCQGVFVAFGKSLEECLSEMCGDPCEDCGNREECECLHGRKGEESKDVKETPEESAEVVEEDTHVEAE